MGACTKEEKWATPWNDAIFKLIEYRRKLEKITDIDAEPFDMAVCAMKKQEHRCITCGRTANNGGWYSDGRTRCPIEETYALPKDGHCHLWEKINPSEDNYPEHIRRMKHEQT